MKDILEKLANLTYSIHHNPNCPSPYQIRLPGKSGILDNLNSIEKTEDIIVYGKNLDEAIKKVLKKLQ